MLDRNDQLPVAVCNANAETKRRRYFKEYFIIHLKMVNANIPVIP